jgi:hypothetical protein
MRHTNKHLTKYAPLDRSEIKGLVILRFISLAMAVVDSGHLRNISLKQVFVTCETPRQTHTVVYWWGAARGGRRIAIPSRHGV